MSPSYKRVLLLLNWYLPRLHSGIVAYARHHNWFLEVAVPRCFRQSLRYWNGDAVITDCDCGYGELAARGIRVGACTELAGYDCAVYDETGAIARIAAQYFRNKGHRNFAFCGGASRCRAFAEAVAAHGAACTALSISTSLPLSGRQAEKLMRQLCELPRPCAIFCENDWVGGKVFMLAHEAGIRVPDDLAILGAGNDELQCHSTIIPLSSVESRLYDRGMLLAEMLDRCLEGKAFERVCAIPPLDQVVERGSTAFYAVNDERVREMIGALAREVGNASFQIAELAKRFHCDESTLYRHFMRQLGMSPKQLLQNMRFEHARGLLRESSAKVSAIEADSGFPSAASFFEAFKANCGTTPEAWRKRFR